MKLEEFRQSLKNPRMLNFMKFRPVGKEIQEVGQIDGDENTNNGSLNFSSAPKKIQPGHKTLSTLQPPLPPPKKTLIVSQ